MRAIITDSRSLQRVLWLKRRTRITLALPSLSPTRRGNLEARFDHHLADSGGRAAMLFLAVSVVGCLILDLDKRDFFAAHPVSLLTVNIVLCALAALLGKAVGLLRARWQLARLIWSVADLLDEESIPSPPNAAFGVSSASREDRYAAGRRVSA